jgi:alkanesulfonate monooxygenase SsuD/methylene tetrahydromethanopterin reductase-like flavin-dependent oxidoreductase (luciferase family)
VPYPPLRERFERLEETLQLAHQMWRGDESPYAGRHVTLERPLNVPPAVRRPHPPILVGGMGAEKTMRLVARYADACNFFDVGPQRLRGACDVLRERCAEAGRDYDEIDKTVLTRITLSRTGSGLAPSGEPTMSVGQAVEHLGMLAEAGIDTAILGMANDTDPAGYELVAELVRQAEGIVAAGR